MTVHEKWTDQLSDYLDGELSADERGAVEAHLRSCAPCAAVLADLQRIVTRAQSLEARPPRADLWAGIANRIEAGRPAPEPGFVIPFARRDGRRFAFTLPQLAAAAVILMAVSGGIAWEAAVRSPDGLRHTASAPETTSGQDVTQGSRDVAPDFSPGSDTDATAVDRVETIGLADTQYDAAVADLEKALHAGRGRLDASTITIVEHNLHIIDQAIHQAREALVTDPSNHYLSGHLVDARRRKLDLLRRATALATETN
jgi:hypothetical protein